jgi:hypothetical protein
MKKGQAALEFLMTYGWAILVVLVAIGALAYFGVLRPERLLPEKCVIATGSGLYCDDYTVSSTTVTIRVKNMLAETVSINAVRLPGTTCTSSTTAQNVTADSTGDFQLTACGFSSGEKIKSDIAIDFNKQDGLQKTTSGQLVTTAP